MKKICLFLFAATIVAGFSLRAHADLYNRGTDSEGNRLIYDSGLNITWYDYSNAKGTWQNQIDWVSALTVNFGGIDYSDWRLPSTVDGPYVLGFDGTTTAGYNITSGELGHLFYSELHNKGIYSTTGDYQPGFGLKNKGPFVNLYTFNYWSGTEYASDTDFAWYFNPYYSFQDNNFQDFNFSALAVRSGDVAVAPEPVSMALFCAGGLVLAARRMVLRKR